MKIDCDSFFKDYEKVRDQADSAFMSVKEKFVDLVACKESCADCCHALFDLTLIEALYINDRFQKTFDQERRSVLLVAADIADRKTYKIKRKAYQSLDKGISEDEILANLATQRVRCSMLTDDNLCTIYEFRPITCRLYGLPLAIGGKGHTCGLSGFVPGQSYPTVHMDQILNRLLGISAELTQQIKSKHSKMGEILVPLSMALLTDYNDEYLGIETIQRSSKEAGEPIK